jgi:hypothetical protein
VPRGKAPPFKRRLDTAIAAAKAAGATRVKVNPDGSVELDLKPDRDGSETNDFDRPPNPVSRRGNDST